MELQHNKSKLGLNEDMATLFEENLRLKKKVDNLLSQMNLRMFHVLLLHKAGLVITKILFFALIFISVCFNRSHSQSH